MKNGNFIAIVYGWIVILVLILMASMLLSVFIRYTSISEFTLSYLALIIALVILFIGGLAAGVKGKENGWFIGGCTGAGFTLLTFLIQFLGYNTMFSVQQLIFHLTYILAAIVGSIIGVNVAAKKA